MSLGEPGSLATGQGIVNKEGPWDHLNSKIYPRLCAPGLEASTLYPSMITTDLGTG